MHHLALVCHVSPSVFMCGSYTGLSFRISPAAFPFLILLKASLAVSYCMTCPPLIQTACPQPRPVLPPGADLHRKQLMKLNRLRCGTARVGDKLKVWGAQESATCVCGHITQSVQHVVIECMIHKAPDDFAGLRCPDAATRSWMEDLNIEMLRTGKRLYTCLFHIL